MRPWPAVLAVCALVVVAAVESSPTSACGQSEVTFTGQVGVDHYGGGAFVRYDYAFDDRGAATGPAVDDYENLIFPGATAARSTRGAYRYPDAASNNLADIVKVRIDAERVIVTFNALAPGSTVVGVAIDTDLDTETGVGLWPHGAGLTTPGADVVLTGFDGAPGIDYDTAMGTITLPLPVTPDEGQWRFWVGAGLWDGSGWMEVPPGNIGNSPGTGSLGTHPKLFDLAFNTGETYVGYQDYWNERRQAEAIGDGDIGEHHAVVDFGRIRRCEEHHPAPARGTFSTFVYRSSLDLGYGLVPEPRRPHDNFVYLSPWQPYTVYVPTTLREPAPLVWLMHARGMNHNSYTVIDHRFTQIGEELGALVVTPLSRGEYRMCEADAEVDFHETWTSLRDGFDLDDDRTYLAGLSMGGICMWRLGLMYPDRFAAGIAVAASPRMGAYPSYTPLPVPYDMTDYIDNARHLPILVLHGAADVVLPYTDTAPAVARMEELGFEHRVHLYPDWSHDARHTSATWESHVEWLRGRTRNSHPARVSYRTWPQEVGHHDPAVLNGDHGFAYDRAYWLSGIRQHDPAAPSYVDAHMLDRSDLNTAPVDGRGEDEAGSFVYFGRAGDSLSPTAAPGRELHIATENVRSVVVDAQGARLDLDRPVTVTIAGAATVTIAGIWNGIPDVVPSAAWVTAGDVRLRGPGTYVISPRHTPPHADARPTKPAELPVTGTGGAAAAVAFILAALAAGAWRRRPLGQPDGLP